VNGERSRPSAHRPRGAPDLFSIPARCGASTPRAWWGTPFVSRCSDVHGNGSSHGNQMNAKAQTLLAHARKTLLTPYGLDVADLTQVFGKIMTHQVDYADLYFQYSRSEGWSLEEGIVKAGSFSIDEGVGGARPGRRENRLCLFRRHQRPGARRCCRGGAGDCRRRAGARRTGAEKAKRTPALRTARPAGFARRRQQGQAAREARSHGTRRRFSRHAGHGASRRRIRGDPGCRQRRAAGCRRPDHWCASR
jgi:hypothetical protein